ncbi:MAG: DUF5677 domain-containing protein [Candidatus Ferrigenium altingense]
MKKRTDKLSKFRTTYNAHKTQIPTLQRLTLQTNKVIGTLSPDVQKLPFFLRQNVDFNLYALADLNESLVKMLEANRTCSVEALARVATEQAVNLIYVIESESDDRAKSVISRHLAKSTENAECWLKFANLHGLDESTQSAKKKLQHLQYWKGLLDENQQLKSIETWPLSTKKRFSIVGLENLYHTIFSASSDAIHGFHEDIFNSTILHYYPDEIRDDAFGNYLVEKQSFAIFLAAYSVALYIQALYSLAIRVNAQDAGEKLKDMLEVANALISTHENDHKQMT